MMAQPGVQLVPIWPSVGANSLCTGLSYLCAFTTTERTLVYRPLANYTLCQMTINLCICINILMFAHMVRIKLKRDWDMRHCERWVIRHILLVFKQFIILCCSESRAVFTITLCAANSNQVRSHRSDGDRFVHFTITFSFWIFATSHIG